MLFSQCTDYAFFRKKSLIRTPSKNSPNAISSFLALQIPQWPARSFGWNDAAISSLQCAFIRDDLWDAAQRAFAYLQPRSARDQCVPASRSPDSTGIKHPIRSIYSFDRPSLPRHQTNVNPHNRRW